jgi:hypothetical protein
MVYAPVDREKDTIELPSSPRTEVASSRLRNAIIENSDRCLVLGIAELAPIVLNGNSKISTCSAKRLRKQGSITTSGR